MSERLGDPIAAAATDAIARLDNRVRMLEAAGQAIPAIPFPMIPGLNIDAALGAIVTGAAFTSAWLAVVPRIARSALRVEIPWFTPAATTGEVYISLGSGSSSVIALGAGASGTAIFNFLHGQRLWSGIVTSAVFARRTAGAGNVMIYQPRCWLIDPAGCTVTGL